MCNQFALHALRRRTIDVAFPEHAPRIPDPSQVTTTCNDTLPQCAVWPKDQCDRPGVPEQCPCLCQQQPTGVKPGCGLACRLGGRRLASYDKVLNPLAVEP